MDGRTDSFWGDFYMTGLVRTDCVAAKMGRNIGLLWTAIVEDENRRGRDPALRSNGS